MATFSSKNPGFGELGFIRNIAGYLTLASIRAAELANLMRSCGAQVAESWRGDAHAAWDAQLTEQASATQALAPQWDAVSGALTTYADTVQGIFDRGEGFRATIDSHLSSAASSDISVRFMVVDGQQYHVTLTPQNTADATGEARASGEARAEELQELINAQVDAFWALQSERDAADGALTGVVGANFPAGWSDLKAQFPAGTNPSTMLPVVPREFYGYDGIDAAGEVAGLVDPATGAVDPAAWTMINSHMEDPIFREHFMAVLGPERAIVMGMDARIDNLNGEKSKLEDMQILLIAGAPPARYDGDWMEKAEATITGLPLPTQEHAASTILADIVGKGTPVRRDGFEVSWNQMSLAMLANTVLVGWQGYKPSTNWDAAKGFFGALGNNPGAAAIAFGGHPEEYLEVGKSHPVGAFGIGFEDSYAKFLQAATVTAAEDSKWRGFADSNVSFIIGAVGAGGENQYFTDETRVVFGEIAGKYWNGLEKSATARWAMVDDPSLPGVERPFKEWENFLLEAMRNPGVANRTLALFDPYGKVFDPTSPSGQPVGSTYMGYYDDDGDLHFADADSGRVGSYFNDRFKGDMIAVRDGLLRNLINEAQADYDSLNSAQDAMVDEIWGLAEDPKGWAVGKAKDILRGLIKEAFNPSTVQQDSLRDMRAAKDAETGSGWEIRAVEVYNDGSKEPGHGFAPVQIGKDGEIFYGDPHLYELQVESQINSQKLPGQPFVDVRILDENKRIRSIDELRADPPSYRAYIAWLQDPAVQAQIHDSDDRLQR